MISEKLLIRLVPKVWIIVKNKFTEKFKENIFQSIQIYNLPIP